MLDPSIGSYVGMGTGVIGAVTGIAGGILGYIGYRKTNEIKSLDLRIELKKGIIEFSNILSKTEKLLPCANVSRQRVAAALGGLESGAMVKWRQDYESDLTVLKGLPNNRPSISCLEKLNQISLEKEIINLHGLQLKVKELNEKYSDYMQVDEVERGRLRSKY